MSSMSRTSRSKTEGLVFNIEDEVEDDVLDIEDLALGVSDEVYDLVLDIEGEVLDARTRS